MKKKLTTKIKKYRINRGMSQQDLANLVDVRRETIIRLEKGEYNPSLQLAMDIADVFQITIEELFSFELSQEE
ncbi:helix-turn-helix transcriptional regulator [Desulfosporosinus sp. FKA]|uniref:helix-turn-helix transcriptional regulator n=1 Tax=Desulfosporosinus sp. FKA TaxID=1969834 RepID=UPI000B49B97B|nr:helix-turn-helix transcriptional regulator [Desulfosporosinus sp. FKA]